MRRALQWIVGLLAVAFFGSAVVGAILGGGILHPARRALDAALIAQASNVFARDSALCQEVDVPAQDGVILRGWKVQARSPNGDWVMLFHGQSDNRVGRTLDRRIPCRHARRIFRATTGPKELWVVRGAQHTGAYGIDPAEFRRRVLAFFAAYR